MDSKACGYRAKNRIKMNNEVNGFGIGMNSDTLLIIKLPDLRVLRIMSRSLFLAVVLLVLVFLSCMRRDYSNAFYESDADSDINCFKILPIIFRNLVDEGLVKKANRELILGACIETYHSMFSLYLLTLNWFSHRRNKSGRTPPVGRRRLSVRALQFPTTRKHFLKGERKMFYDFRVADMIINGTPRR
ncbi:Uncharacterized protein Fot_16775 [Forsythia ovata]|uniref:Uncharacterized protein n=1 Tax=Forsythia ovata TaxID=205694 RepID=A0ABD1VDG4_9LAMI